MKKEWKICCEVRDKLKEKIKSWKSGDRKKKMLSLSIQLQCSIPNFKEQKQMIHKKKFWFSYVLSISFLVCAFVKLISVVECSIVFDTPVAFNMISYGLF